MFIFFFLLFVDHSISLSSLPCSRRNPVKQLFSSSTFLNLFIDLFFFFNNLYLFLFFSGHRNCETHKPPPELHKLPSTTKIYRNHRQICFFSPEGPFLCTGQCKF
ncbi:hypothetical protein NC652_018463 [Populus alba x Populus x berolinensis]|nr:hypothetical protein NC652_018463 [Populus alba x Populus x berolinensis]